MQTDDDMGDANRANDGDDNGPLDDIAGEVGAPGIIEIDIIIGDASISITERGAKLGKKGNAIPTDDRRRGGLGGEVGGHDTQPGVAASIPDCRDDPNARWGKGERNRGLSDSCRSNREGVTARSLAVAGEGNSEGDLSGRMLGQNVRCGGADDRPGLALDWTGKYQDIKRADHATARATRPGGREPDVRGRDADDLDPNSTGYIRGRMEARCVGSYER